MKDKPTFPVDRRPLKADGGSFRTMVLKFTAPDVAVLTRSGQTKIFGWVCMLLGMGFAIGVCLFQRKVTPSFSGRSPASQPAFLTVFEAVFSVFGYVFCGLAVLLGLFFTMVGLLIVLGRFGAHPVVFDLTSGEMATRAKSVAPGTPRRRLDDLKGLLAAARGKRGSPTRAIPIRDIAALQICSREVKGGGEGSYVTWELNAVLSRPQGERVSLMSHGNEKALLGDADKLSEFLAVPILDHSVGEEEG